MSKGEQRDDVIGQLMPLRRYARKMCNQIAIAGALQGVSEALRFAQHADLDIDKVFEAIEERTARVLEEAIELFDSEHRDREAARAQAHKMVDHVFDHAKGEVNQEAGGLIVTLLAYCGAKGVRLDKLADDEIARVMKMSKEHFVKRQQTKAAAGVAMLPE